MGTRRSGSLTSVPVYFTTDTTLADGKGVAAGHTAWLSASDAAACERGGFGVICLALSVSELCRLPDGRALRPESEIVAVLPDHADALESLEAAGKVRILRSDADLERHRAAWREYGEAVKAAIAESRRRMREAEEFARKADRSVPRPRINWDAPLAKAS